MSLRARTAATLEAGRAGLLTAATAEVWSTVAARCVSRPLRYPRGARVIAIGGATLGGSGKTPLAVACARWLAERGESVALIGHAYGARPRRARVVEVDDSVDVVGDEALDAARSLAGLGVSVVVARTRQQALELGLRHASIAVVDGMIQCRPRRATLSLLAIDAARPWGAGWCPPRGDLRAPPDALLAACDRVVVVRGTDRSPLGLDRPTDEACVVSSGIEWAGEEVGWDDVRGRSVGLCTTIARPGRVLDLLAHKGVTPRAFVRFPDHAARSALAASVGRVIAGAPRDIDLWLCTSKCATRLPASLGGAPIGVIRYAVSVPDSLAEALRGGVDGSSKGP